MGGLLDDGTAGGQESRAWGEEREGGEGMSTILLAVSEIEQLAALIRQQAEREQSRSIATIVAACVVAAIICAMFGWAVGETRRRPGFGFLLGLFLGPIGVLTAVLLPEPTSEAHHGTEPQPQRTARLKTAPPVAQVNAWLDGQR